MTRQLARLAYLLLVAVAVGVMAAPATAAQAGAAAHGGWAFAGQNVRNTRNAGGEHDIGPGSASHLRMAWSLAAAGDVTVTPTEAGGTLYFPDGGGQLWAVDARSGRVRWSHSIPDYTGIAGDVSRTSPAVAGDEIVLGDTYPLTAEHPTGPGAFVMAVDRGTGRKLWVTRVDAHPAARITSSAVVYRGVVYVGVSSDEEVLAAVPGYTCCSFRGSVVAMDAATGRLLWKTYTIQAAGYSGGSVWGSTPAIDPDSDLLFVGTGNGYSAPAGVCTTPGETGCTQPAPGDHADAILALDRTTGAIRWFKNTLSDVFTLACSGRPGCGPDFDFGSGPNLFRLASGRQLLGAGQKSGIYWALNPETGATVWATQVGAGGAYGGIEWGSATDGRRIYTAIGDFEGTPYAITTGSGRQLTITGGSWAALDAATGRILWQVADPQGASDNGFVSVADGVVYAASTAETGDNMYALDAATGGILWGFASGGPVVSGAAIAGGMVYWGSGYSFATACPGGFGPTKVCIATNSDKLYAFTARRRS